MMSICVNIRQRKDGRFEIVERSATCPSGHVIGNSYRNLVTAISDASFVITTNSTIGRDVSPRITIHANGKTWIKRVW